LDIKNGRDILLADSAPVFASSVIELLRDRTHRERIEDCASKTAARYDWSVVTEQFEKVLVDLVGVFGQHTGRRAGSRASEGLSSMYRDFADPLGSHRRRG
jgi:hypothetical protein